MYSGNKLERKDDISVLGSVSDIRSIIDKSTVFVVPQNIVSGVRYKILEAMAMGIPVVSTSLGCEGLEVIHNENIMVADSKKEFARCIISLIEDRVLWDKITMNARAFIEKRHRIDIESKKLSHILSELVKEN